MLDWISSLKDNCISALSTVTFLDKSSDAQPVWMSSLDSVGSSWWERKDSKGLSILSNDCLNILIPEAKEILYYGRRYGKSFETKVKTFRENYSSNIELNLIVFLKLRDYGDEMDWHFLISLRLIVLKFGSSNFSRFSLGQLGTNDNAATKLFEWSHSLWKSLYRPTNL